MTAKSTQTKPSIVFCHGLWADGSCFSKVIPALPAEGHQVLGACLSNHSVGLLFRLKVTG
jgi:hypothetical protein